MAAKNPHNPALPKLEAEAGQAEVPASAPSLYSVAANQAPNL
jgi:hypothetical protein